MVTPVMKYQTADGELFDTEQAAQQHEIYRDAKRELATFLVQRGTPLNSAENMAATMLNNLSWVTRFMQVTHAKLYPPEPQK